jgi:hypothetical protein
MMVLQINKPGVNITQSFAGTPTVPVAPELVPCIVGPAFQVIDIIAADGTMSDDAKTAVIYDQVPLTVQASQFSSPRVTDPAQQTVLPDEVLVATKAPGTGEAQYLSRDSAFLTHMPNGYAPALFIPAPVGSETSDALGIDFYNGGEDGEIDIVLAATAATLSAVRADRTLTITLPTTNTEVSAIVAAINDLDLALSAAANGDVTDVAHTAALVDDVGTITVSAPTFGQSTFIYALDLMNAAAVTNDIIVTIPENSTPTMVAGAINANQEIPRAARYVLDGRPGVLLYSSRVGASGNVVTRQSSGNRSNTFGMRCLTSAGRGNVGIMQVTGTGLYATEIDAAGLYSDLVQYQTGRLTYTTSLPTGKGLWHSGDGNNPKQSVPTAADFFDELCMRGATVTKSGDLVTAITPVGAALSGVMIRDVRATSFRLCEVDATLSTYDADGGIIAQRYKPKYVGTLKNETGFFAPKAAFVIAQSLTDYTEDADSVPYRAWLHSVDLSTVPSFAAATHASVRWAPPAAGIDAVRGLSGDVSVEYAGNTVTRTLTFPLVGTLADVANAFAAEFNLGLPANMSLSVSVSNNKLTFTTTRTGATTSLALPRSGLWASGTFTGGASADIGSDNEITGAGFTSQPLIVRLDGMQDATYTASSTSLDTFVDDANTLAGYDLLSLELLDLDEDDTTTKTLHLVVRSPLVGVASRADVDKTTGIGRLLFADQVSSAAVATRPNPELRVRVDGTLDIAPRALRSVKTGLPLAGQRPIYVGYRALRLDISSSAPNAAPIEVSDTTTLETNYGPISPRNPLGLALYFALINGGAGQTITALGVDAVSEAEPEGTTIAYTRALELLRGFEVHTLVPLTHSEDVIAVADVHVKDMSAPENRMERTLIGAPLNPIRENDVSVLSTTDTGAASGDAQNIVILDENPTAPLEAAGLDTQAAFPFELTTGEQLYLALTIGSNIYRYSVVAVSGSAVTIRDPKTLTALQNADGFYSSAFVDAAYAGASYTLSLRGKSLYDKVTGELLRTKYAETIRNKAQQYENRRQMRLYPESVQSSAIGGIQLSLPSYYWGAALASAASNALASQPFTRLPLVGFNGVSGPRLERKHLDVISAGTAVIDVDRVGEAPALRLQSTTDTTTIEAREWSVTRAIDLFAKQVRSGILGRIGRYNITNEYTGSLRMLVASICSSVVSTGVLRSANLASLSQNAEQPDTVDITITVEALYPANYINVTISI